MENIPEYAVLKVFSNQDYRPRLTRGQSSSPTVPLQDDMTGSRHGLQQKVKKENP